MVEEKRQQRTGGRSGLVIAAVRRAVEELLAEMSADQLSVTLVAQRAGVHTTSIYRRWNDLATLIAEVAQYKLDPGRPLPRSGVLRADMIAWGTALAEHVAVPANAALLRAGAALAGDPGSDCTSQWRAEAAEIIRAAPPEQQVIPAHALIDHVLAPIVYRAIFSQNDPMRRKDVSRLVDETLLQSPEPW